MVQARGTGRDGGRLYADVVRERRASTANRFELLQGEQKRRGNLHGGLDREEDRQNSTSRTEGEDDDGVSPRCQGR